MHPPDAPTLSPLVGKNLLITGGSGAFGTAFARLALDAGARRVAIFSRGEARQAAMRAAFGDDPRLRWFIGDVRSRDRLRDALRGVDLCVHAAALKRVEVCEANPDEAIATNVGGTLNVAHACIEAGVAKAVLLSTDKAAAPSTLYGLTKGAAERAWLAMQESYAAGTGTIFSASRYGNVIGSTGSVIPLWRAQMARGDALTITDPNATRFLMTMDDATALVVRVLASMRGGETFVPSMSAASVREMAYALDAFAAFTEVGLRAGEKRHETLISADEALRTRDCGTYYVIEPATRPFTGVGVADGFELRSDTAQRFPSAVLAAMVHGA